MVPDLSIIIPFVNEYPQVIFTIKNLAEEFRDRVDFEIIAINNYVKGDPNVVSPEDKGYEYLKNVEKGNEWLRVLKYDEKLSHWNAKRIGVEASSSPFLFFCDSHCIISRDAGYTAFQLYSFSHRALNGTLHLPLTYLILEWRKLIYKLVSDVDRGIVHYSFSSYKNSEHPYEVPCMSTCGMFMSRELYDLLGGFPKELGIYGGGENFINFTLSVLGKKKWIMPGHPLYHHGERRTYSYTYTDYLKNRAVATYLFGGEKFLSLFISNAKGRKDVLEDIKKYVLRSCKNQREHIKSNQKLDIVEWVNAWTKKKG